MGYKEFSSIMRHHQAPLKPCKEWLHSSSIAMLIIQFPVTRLKQKYEQKISRQQIFGFHQVKMS